MSLWTRVVNAFRAERLDRELDEEFHTHLEEAIAAGRIEDKATHAFGGTLPMRERSHDVKVLGWLESIVGDAKFGARQLRKNWITSAAAILSLALAIGACTAAFRLIDAVLLRPLPVKEPGAAVLFSNAIPGSFRRCEIWRRIFVSPLPANARFAARRGASTRGKSARRQGVTYGRDNETEKVYVQYFSGNTFPSFGLTPAAGRLLTPADDDKPGAHAVAVLSYEYWTSRFGSDSETIGRTFRMGEQLYQIVGIAPEGFTGTDVGTITDLFIPTMMNTAAIEKANWQWFRIWIRLRQWRNIYSVRDQLQAIYSTFLREQVKQWKNMLPEDMDEYLKSRLLVRSAESGRSLAQHQYGLALVTLGVLVALVLLIACANIANLMTAQATSRAREMALRVSIGAGRMRLVQLVFIESALLAISAAWLGGLFAWWSAPFVVSMVNPPDNPPQLVLPADWRVLEFTAVLAIVVTVLFGMTPALRASSVKPAKALRGGEDPHTRRRLIYGLVLAQVAFCFVVTFAAGLFTATFDRLAAQPTGFATGWVLTVATVVKGNKPRAPEVWTEIADHLRGIPKVQAAGYSSWALMSGNGWSNWVRLPAQRADDYEVYFLGVSPEYLKTMGIALVEGRDFRLADSRTEPQPAIVSEAFVKRYYREIDPIGRTFERPEDNNKVVRNQIIGVIKDIRYRDMREPMRPVVFLPCDDMDWATFAVRTPEADAASLAPMVRAEVTRVRPEFRVVNIVTQRELVDQWTIRERLLAALSIFFAGIAQLLAGVGLYGVLNYSVLQRTREIGIRMALGARARDVVGGIATPLLAVVLAGMAAGLGPALGCRRFLQNLLFSVKPTDARMIAIPIAFLAAVTLIAVLPAVLRAVRIDPAQALRAE